MSTTSVPVGQIQGAAAPNPLGRTALVIAIIGLVIAGVWTIIQLTVFNYIGMTVEDGTAQLLSVLSTAVYGVDFLLSLVSTVLGIKACRRPGLSKLAAGIAVGVSGSSLVSFAAMLLGMGIFALISI